MWNNKNQGLYQEIQIKRQSPEDKTERILPLKLSAWIVSFLSFIDINRKDLNIISHLAKIIELTTYYCVKQINKWPIAILVLSPRDVIWTERESVRSLRTERRSTIRMRALKEQDRIKTANEFKIEASSFSTVEKWHKLFWDLAISKWEKFSFYHFPPWATKWQFPARFISFHSSYLPVSKEISGSSCECFLLSTVVFLYNYFIYRCAHGHRGASRPPGNQFRSFNRTSFLHLSQTRLALG